MEQSDIQKPEIVTGAGWSFGYSVYLHCGAWLLRKAVAYLTGDASEFTQHRLVATPGLGEGSVKCSICLPSSNSRTSETLPLILVLEGGGFVLGQPTDGVDNDRLLSDKLEAVVVSVDYAKSPRYPFPHALLQIYQVLQWCLSPEAADVLGVAIDASRVAIMGNSAGGNLTAALSLLTTFTSGPCKSFRVGLPSNYRQVAQILLYPSTALNQQYSARLAQSSKEVQAKSLPAWVAELMEASYLPPMVEKEQIFVAPIVADPTLLKDMHKDIAPVFCYLAGMDCLKDEGARYCQRLRDAGVEVETRVYPEAIHGFSHYKPGNKDYREDDVKDCWGNIIVVLSRCFQRPAHPHSILRE